jgi:predicted N-acetyltransferase YhbS
MTTIAQTGLRLRPGTPADAAECGRIAYEAFAAIATQHGFPPDFPAPDVAVGLLAMMLSHPGFFSTVAEMDGRVVGSNFLDERSTIVGVGPITVDPQAQNSGIGRELMLAVMERARSRDVPGVRLLQAAYHCRSLSLYASLGFVTREPVACMAGRPPAVSMIGRDLRLAEESDIAACNAVCFKVHGHDRAGELADALKTRTAVVVEHDGRITGYATAIAFFAHAVGETNDDLKSLIGTAKEFQGPGILVPARNADLFQWCLSQGLRVVQVMNLMTVGLYNEPAGAYLPSILY